MSIQLLLAMLSSRRKTTKSKWLLSFISILHSAADWLAVYGFGVISTTTSQGINSSDEFAVPNELLALWASFYLMYLAGANTVNSLSSSSSSSDDDYYLWLKQLVVLVSQVVAIIFIFLKSFPNKLLVPTILVFVAAILRNLQRLTSSLGRSHKNLKDSRGKSPSSNISIFSEAFSKMINTNLQKKRPWQPSNKFLSLLWGVDDGHGQAEMNSFWIAKFGTIFYDSFKCFIRNVTFSSRHRLFSRKFFSNRTPFDAFKLLEMELDCMYEDLYTQSLDRYGIFGSVIYAYNVYLLFAALVVFLIALVKIDQYYTYFDVVLTLVLLCTAIAQEFIISFGSMFSPRYYLSKQENFLKKIEEFMKRLLKNNGSVELDTPSDEYLELDTDFSYQIPRWSESVCHVNLLAWCLPYHSKLGMLAEKAHPKLRTLAEKVHSKLRSITENVVSLIDMKDIVDILSLKLSVTVHPINGHVKETIFEELRTKSSLAKSKETAMKICSQRGDWALMRSSFYMKLKWSVGELEYCESLILWHIATELCYNGVEFEGNDDSEMDKERTFCKIVSDYMFYILVLKPTMIASVAGDWETVFHDTCADVRTFYLPREVKNKKEACEQILSTYNHTSASNSESDNNNRPLLARASYLAEQLMCLQGEQWKVMSKVWVELLSYAAYNCEPAVHAEQPSQGGELLTFVWLLMNHLGLGKQIMEVDDQLNENTEDDDQQVTEAEDQLNEYIEAGEMHFAFSKALFDL